MVVNQCLCLKRNREVLALCPREGREEDEEANLRKKQREEGGNGGHKERGGEEKVDEDTVMAEEVGLPMPPPEP